jgi:hypothetical protein
MLMREIQLSCLLASAFTLSILNYADDAALRCSRRLCFTIGLFSSLLPAAWCVVNSTILTSIQHP